MNSSPVPAHRDAAPLLLLVTATVVLYAVISRLAGFELHYDEAQYWEWSKQLDWSYYSKGPLVAWAIALSTAVFGDGEWQVRLPGWIVHGLFLAAIYGFARDLQLERRAAWWAVAIAFTTPMYFVLGIVMTTDSLLLLFWTLGLWSLFHALFKNSNVAWYAAGAAIGIGALTKLSIGLLPAFSGIAVLLNRELRPQLRNPHLWGGMVVLFGCMSPVLIWNATHGYVMFLHEVGHVTSTESKIFERTLEFLASQLVALSPLMVALGVMTLRHKPEQPGRRFIWSLSFAWFAFFVVKSFEGKIQVNWAAIIYVGMIVLLASRIDQLTRLGRALLVGGIATSILLVLIMLYPQGVGLHASQFAPIKKLKGWRGPIESIATQVGDIDFILTDSYITAAEVAFYWPKRVPVYVMGSTDRRFNQHDLWPGVDREQSRNAAIIQTDYTTLPEPAISAFERCSPTSLVDARDDGGVLRTFSVNRCENYHHIDWPKPQYY